MTSPRFLLLVLVFMLAPVLGFSETADLRKKVGQLFILGFPQDRFDSDLQALIEKWNPGGFVLFRRNLRTIPEIRQLTESLKNAASGGAEPFLAIDQEGGSVTRISFFPALPSAYAVGISRRTDLAHDLGLESGKLLRWLGFNMNLAPVLDLANPLQSSFIGSRSFGSDPIDTGKMGTAYAKGLIDAGVLPTAKHFPGLGATAVDPHRAMSAISSSRSVFEEKDFIPFKNYSEIGSQSALMVSQFSYPSLDPSGIPAPFSKSIMQDVLRGSIGFQGLVVTDDLQMKGSALFLAPAEAALVSLKAGADLIMISWSKSLQEKAMQRIVRAVENGEWSEQELNTKVARILKVKSMLLTNSLPVQIGQGPDGQLGTRKLERIDLSLLDAKIRDHEEKKERMPSSVSSPKTTCVLSSSERFISSYRQGAKSRTRYLRINEDEEKDLTALTTGCQRVIVPVLQRKQLKLLSDVPPSLQKKTVLINMGPAVWISKRKKWGDVIDIGFPHLHSGYRIAQWSEGAFR